MNAPAHPPTTPLVAPEKRYTGRRRAQSFPSGVAEIRSSCGSTPGAVVLEPERGLLRMPA